MSAWVYGGVAVLGAAGAYGRFALEAAIRRRSRTSFPVGTFVVNVGGALVLGVLVGLSVAGDALVLAGAGLLGSFTTFSTWMLDTERLAEDDLGRSAAVNLLGGLAGGAAAAAVGWALGATL